MSEIIQPTPQEICDVLDKVTALLTKREQEVLAWVAANIQLATPLPQDLPKE